MTGIKATILDIYIYSSTRRIQKKYIYIYISWKPAHIQGKTSSIITHQKSILEMLSYHLFALTKNVSGCLVWG